MATPVQKSRLTVQVVALTGGAAFEKTVLVPCGQTVGWCANASGVYALHPALQGAKLGVWGKVVPPETLAADGDRIELYTPATPEAVAAARTMKSAK